MIRHRTRLVSKIPSKVIESKISPRKIKRRQIRESYIIDCEGDLYYIIENFCDTYDYRFYDDYSGRGMYGSTCIGIVVPHSKVSSVTSQLIRYIERSTGEAIDSSLESDLMNSKVDNMGLNMIVYFPNVSCDV